WAVEARPCSCSSGIRRGGTMIHRNHLIWRRLFGGISQPTRSFTSSSGFLSSTPTPPLGGGRDGGRSSKHQASRGKSLLERFSSSSRMVTTRRDGRPSLSRFHVSATAIDF